MGFYQEREIADNLAQACRVLGAFDMTNAALGHVSYRLEGTDSMLIKGKGPNEVGLRYTRTRDIVKVDFEAEMLDGPDDLQPPSESFLHIWIYKNRPDVKSVVHVHPEYALLLGITGKADHIYQTYSSYDGSSAAFAREGLPIYPSSRTIATPEQGDEFARCMGNKNGALMVGHGIATAGEGIEQSTLNALALERLCRITYKSYLIGTPNPLPEGDLAAPRREPGEGRRRRGSVGGTEGMMATWRYYVGVAEERLGHHVDRNND